MYIWGKEWEPVTPDLARGQINIRRKQLIKSCRFYSSSMEYQKETFGRFLPNTIGAVTPFLGSCSH